MHQNCFLTTLRNMESTGEGGCPAHARPSAHRDVRRRAQGWLVACRALVDNTCANIAYATPAKNTLQTHNQSSRKPTQSCVWPNQAPLELILLVQTEMPTWP